MFGQNKSAPASGADRYKAFHDQTLVVDASTGVLSDDTDADGDSLTASLLSLVERFRLEIRRCSPMLPFKSFPYGGGRLFRLHLKST